jgi:hypothetical protein
MPNANNAYPLRRIFPPRVLLFFFVLAQPLGGQSQAKPSKWRSGEDSLIIVQKHLERWHPYAGIHLSSDPELYYLGPSFQAGLDYNFTTHLALSTYLHYFHVSTNNNNDNGIIEIGRLRTFTSALLLQVNAGAGWYKGFFIGGGVALQRYADRFQGIFGSWDTYRTTFTPAIRIGYIFSAGLHAIALEFNGTGPYSYPDGYGGTYMEVFTQVSIGARFIF